jgi:imidazolonepropionase-like amidohydrolase
MPCCSGAVSENVTPMMRESAVLRASSMCRSVLAHRDGADGIRMSRSAGAKSVPHESLAVARVRGNARA